MLVSKKDVDIFTAVVDSQLDSDFEFGAEQGFNIAVKWQSLTDETEALDPSVGRIVFLHLSWGYQEDTGQYYEEEGEIESHLCSLEELGLRGDEATFMPVHSMS